MSAGEIVGIVSALTILIGALATYRNSVRKSDFDRLQARVVEAEHRLAQAETRATAFERQANEARTDIIQLGEALTKEREESCKRICEMERAYQLKINKLVLIIESLFKQMQAAGLEPADVDLEDLKMMYVVEKK
jgi:hypothetical protein